MRRCKECRWYSLSIMSQRCQSCKWIKIGDGHSDNFEHPSWTGTPPPKSTISPGEAAREYLNRVMADMSLSEKEKPESSINPMIVIEAELE